MHIYFNKKLWSGKGIFGKDYINTLLISICTVIQLLLITFIFLIDQKHFDFSPVWWPLQDGLRVTLIVAVRLIWLYTKERVYLPIILFGLNCVGLLTTLVGLPIYLALINKTDGVNKFETIVFVCILFVVMHTIMSLPILIMVLAPSEINEELNIEPLNRRGGNQVGGDRRRFGGFFGFGGGNTVEPDREAQGIADNTAPRPNAEELERMQIEEEQRQIWAQEEREVQERERAERQALVDSQNRQFAEAEQTDLAIHEGLAAATVAEAATSRPSAQSQEAEATKEGRMVNFRVRFPSGSASNFALDSGEKVNAIYKKVHACLDEQKMKVKSFSLIEANGMRPIEKNSQKISERFRESISTGSVFMLLKVG